MNSMVSTARVGPQDGVMGDKQGLLPPILVQYWHKVVHWRWPIIGIISACLLGGLVITLLTPFRYTAQSEIEISREQKQITNVQGVESQQAGRDLEFYATQYALLKARPLAERVAKDLHLARSRDFMAAHGRGGRYDQLTESKDFAKRDREIVELLLDNVSIDPVRTSRLVNIDYTSRSPNLAAAIANAWPQAFIAATVDRQFESTADARRILESRLNALRDRLEQSERQVVNYASQQQIVTLDQVRDETGKTQVARTLAASDVEALNAALNRAIEARIAAESRARSDGRATPETVSSQALGLLRQQRADAAADYARLQVKFEPEYPAVREAARRVQALDSAINQEFQRISGSRTNEYREALSRENELRDQLSQLKVRLDRQRQASIQYGVYQREADTNRQLYDALLQRYKEIGIAGTVGVSNIAIVQKAEVPSRPSAPRLLINLILSLFVGIVLAALGALVLDQIDEGIREPAKIQDLLGLPLLGYTPMIRGSVQEEINDAKSSTYEAYFTVRSNLAFSTPQGFPRSMMVTSTSPAEGKSSTSLALAVILGRTNRNVLLIDADMRSPSIHDLVGGNNASGLSNFLTGQDDWRSLLQPSALKGVSILSAGPPPPNAAELLTGDRLKAFLESDHGFDHVVIDSPPVLGLADAPLISQAVQGCVLVVESRSVALRAVRSSIARLMMAHANIFGVVLTKLQYREGGYGYGYGYSYGNADRNDEQDRG